MSFFSLTWRLGALPCLKNICSNVKISAQAVTAVTAVMRQDVDVGFISLGVAATVIRTVAGMITEPLTHLMG